MGTQGFETGEAVRRSIAIAPRSLSTLTRVSWKSFYSGEGGSTQNGIPRLPLPRTKCSHFTVHILPPSPPPQKKKISSNVLSLQETVLIHVVLMVGQRRRWWTSIKTTLVQYIAIARYRDNTAHANTIHLSSAGSMLGQRR